MTIDALTLTLNSFLTIFLGSYLASVPFFLVGVVLSGLVEEFVTPEQLSRILPSHPIATIFAALLVGVAVPVTDHGIVPVSRRLIAKGLPVSSALTLTLAAPTINLMVAATMVTSFGIGLVTAFRFVIVGMVSCLLGIIYELTKDSGETLVSKYSTGDQPVNYPATDSSHASLVDRLRRSARFSSDEFFELSPWLMLGSALVTIAYSFAQSVSLVHMPADPLGAIILFQLRGFLQGSGSLELALYSKPFTAYVPSGVVLAYLTLGSMLNLRNIPLMIRVFSLRTVAHMALIAFLTVSTVCLLVSLNFS